MTIKKLALLILGLSLIGNTIVLPAQKAVPFSSVRFKETPVSRSFLSTIAKTGVDTTYWTLKKLFWGDTWRGIAKKNLIWGVAVPSVTAGYYWYRSRKQDNLQKNIIRNLEWEKDQIPEKNYLFNNKEIETQFQNHFVETDTYFVNKKCTARRFINTEDKSSFVAKKNLLEEKINNQKKLLQDEIEKLENIFSVGLGKYTTHDGLIRYITWKDVIHDIYKESECLGNGSDKDIISMSFQELETVKSLFEEYREGFRHWNNVGKVLLNHARNQMYKICLRQMRWVYNLARYSEIERTFELLVTIQNKLNILIRFEKAVNACSTERTTTGRDSTGTVTGSIRSE